MMRRVSTILGVVGTLALLGSPAPMFSQEAPEASALAITAIRVEPEKPSADTLCRLRVEIENTDERIATQLGFTVTVNGQKLPVYESHLFMFPLPPGAKTELPLYNFWSTETSRPEPANGKLEIVVTLREARWMKIAMEDEVETWTPLGDVTGLPLSRSITVPLSKSGG